MTYPKEKKNIQVTGPSLPVSFFVPRAISWLLPSFRPAALVAFVAPDEQFVRPQDRWMPQMIGGKNGGLEKHVITPMTYEWP